VTEQQKGQVLGEFTSSTFKNADAMMGDAGADFWQTPSVDMRLKSISLAVCPAYGGPDLDFTLKLFDAVAADTALVNEVAGAEGEFTGLAPAVYSSNAGNLDVTDSAVLVDNDRDGAVGTPLWTVDEWIGAILVNATDGSYGVITSNTVSGATATLAGGSNNFWSATDDYYIMKLFTKEFSTHIVLDPAKWYGVAMQANAGISGFRIANTSLADRSTVGERAKVNDNPLTYPAGLDSPLVDNGIGTNVQFLFSAMLSDAQSSAPTLTTPITKSEGWVALAAASGADRTLTYSSGSRIEYAISAAQPAVDLEGHEIQSDLYSIVVPDGYTMWIKTGRNAAEIVTTEF